MLDYGIYALAHFHKDSVTSCKKIEKYCDDWKILWWLKNTVMFEKYCNDWKILW